MSSVLVPLATGCEELEAVTVIDLLRRAGIDVVTASLDGEPVRASRGVTLVADTLLDEALRRDFDMVVLPGGAEGARRLGEDDRVTELLRKLADSERFTAAICAGPKVLAGAGLLEGRQATAFPGALDDVPGVELRGGEPVVVDASVVTSRGPGTAMDFALRLIELLAGEAQAAEVEQQLQRPSGHRQYNGAA
ncbi:DJ-1 family glyoxalase III [Alkalilimnicola ehrlichii]|uniref:DJ-1 family glyoxalase III n=1 Tax=Alkalilimnicola ehrlichii TaxID=351052 RepID=UPI003B9F0A45